VFIEVSDVVFAVDSVPTIFAITREPLIVFTSNVFAILGLRSLYFLLAGAVHSFHLLKYGLGVNIHRQSPGCCPQVTLRLFISPDQLTRIRQPRSGAR
jgi:hypothetical protein